MVLSNCVCRECNGRLGALDLVLGRDSYEGLIRGERRLGRKHRRDRFEARRLRLNIPDEPQYGAARGLRVIFNWQARALVLLDQVLVTDFHGRVLSLTPDELSRSDPDLFRDRPPGAIRIFATSESAVAQLQSVIEAKGVRFSTSPSSEPLPQPSAGGKISLEIDGLIDQYVFRAIAKISFNYLAAIQGAAYVLDEKFDAIRKFVVGQRNDRSLVRLQKQPILSGDAPRWKSNAFHLVLFETQGRTLRGRVSLFNSLTYEVLLCSDLHLYYSLKSGHAFDPVRRDVYSLVGISRVLRAAGS